MLLKIHQQQKAFACDHCVWWPVLQNRKGSSGFTQNALLCQKYGTELTAAVLLRICLISRL